MAPEVSTSQDYGFGCDVYSFAILLWEVCTLKKPFREITYVRSLNEQVVKGYKRPSVKSIPSSTLRDLLRRGWDKDASKRPSFSSIVHSLESEISSFHLGEPCDLSVGENLFGTSSRRWPRSHSRRIQAFEMSA